MSDAAEATILSGNEISKWVEEFLLIRNHSQKSISDSFGLERDVYEARCWSSVLCHDPEHSETRQVESGDILVTALTVDFLLPQRDTRGSQERCGGIG